jgi:hypothetical protein
MKTTYASRQQYASRQHMHQDNIMHQDNMMHKDNIMHKDIIMHRQHKEHSKTPNCAIICRPSLIIFYSFDQVITQAKHNTDLYSGGHSG